MNIHELIQELQKIPNQNMNVVVRSSSGVICEVQQVKVVVQAPEIKEEVFIQSSEQREILAYYREE